MFSEEEQKWLMDEAVYLTLCVEFNYLPVKLDIYDPPKSYLEFISKIFVAGRDGIETVYRDHKSGEIKDWMKDMGLNASDSRPTPEQVGLI